MSKNKIVKGDSMSQSKQKESTQKVSYKKLTTALDMAELGATASECHGVICGLICGGVNVEDNSWSGAFKDLMNDGMGLPVDLKNLLQSLFETSVNEFVGGEYQVKLLLADDEQPWSQVALSLSQWCESFMAGFGIGDGAKKKLTKEVNEAMSDLSQISQIDTEIEDDEESQRSFEEISEYVRLSAILCFSEFGKKPTPETDKKNLH